MWDATRIRLIRVLRTGTRAFATKAQGWPWIVFQHVAAMRVTVFMVNDLDFLTIGNCLLRKAQQDWDLKRDYRSAFDSG